MKQYLLNIRNYSYLLLAKRHGEHYAGNEYKFLFGVLFAFYYLAIISGVAVIQFKSGIGVPDLLRDGLFTSLIMGGIIFLPYIILIRQILKNLSLVPIDKDMEKEKFSRIRSSFLLTFFGGVASMFLTPWLLSTIL